MDTQLEKQALDIFGRALMEVRDDAIQHWDLNLAGRGNYPPWERLVKSTPGLNESHLDVLRKALPHIVDTVIYYLLAQLDWNEKVCVSVATSNGVVDDLPRHSDGFPAEPCGENGWLVRFSKERFEQPG